VFGCRSCVLKGTFGAVSDSKVPFEASAMSSARLLVRGPGAARPARAAGFARRGYRTDGSRLNVSKGTFGTSAHGS
jgi:hypothetical protein